MNKSEKEDKFYYKIFVIPYVSYTCLIKIFEKDVFNEKIKIILQYYSNVLTSMEFFKMVVIM